MFITIGLLIHLKQTVYDEGMSKRIKVNKGSDLVLKKMFAFVTILIVSRFILKLTFIFRVTYNAASLKGKKDRMKSRALSISSNLTFE